MVFVLFFVLGNKLILMFFLCEFLVIFLEIFFLGRFFKVEFDWGFVRGFDLFIFFLIVCIFFIIFICFWIILLSEFIVFFFWLFGFGIDIISLGGIILWYIFILMIILYEGYLVWFWFVFEMCFIKE